MKRPNLLLLIGVCVQLAACAEAKAHPLDPALLEVWESQAAVDVLWRVPLPQPARAPLQPMLPNACRELSAPRVSSTGSSLTARWRFDCRGSRLVGAQIGVQGLEERQTEALVRVHLADGRLIQAVLRKDSPPLTVPDRASPFAVARDYLALGVEHILTGLDHLLFVLGLILLVHGGHRLVWTITAFTAGHSVTLAFATLGVVRVPSAPVEVLIALSIFFVGVELTRQGQGHAAWSLSCPFIMAFAFGLLHGLGFAGALAQIGLPAGEIPLALSTFNIGIEFGQLLFVLLVMAMRAALNMLPVRWPVATAMLPAYIIGSLAVFWCLERMATTFTTWTH
jgi:hydrogenase/urease accessory protein HupE